MPAKGDGITKRKDGRYMARYTVQTPDGPKRKTIYGKKYKEVERKLNEARANADKGLVFDATTSRPGSGWPRGSPTASSPSWRRARWPTAATFAPRAS